MTRPTEVTLKQLTSEYAVSNRKEYPLSPDPTPILLSYPSFKDLTMARIKGYSLIIDHIKVEYTPQVPFNATGIVHVEVHDNRLNAGETLQAQWSFPIKCHIDLHYYSTSHFSVKDQCPWSMSFRVENANVLSGVHFCKFKGFLKLSACRNPNQIPYRPPTVDIRSKEFTLNDVDFRHVSNAPPQRALCRSSSCATAAPRLALMPGESLQERAETIVGRHSISGPYESLHQLDGNAINPGPSVSEVGSTNRETVISMSADQLGTLIANAMGQMSRPQAQPGTHTTKPI